MDRPYSIRQRRWHKRQGPHLLKPRFLAAFILQQPPLQSLLYPPCLDDVILLLLMAYCANKTPYSYPPLRIEASLEKFSSSPQYPLLMKFACPRLVLQGIQHQLKFLKNKYASALMTKQYLKRSLKLKKHFFRLFASLKKRKHVRRR